MMRLVLLLSLVTVVSCQTVFRPRCPSKFAWVRDPNDCTHFWRCNWGAPIEMPRCPVGLVLSARLNVCVRRGGMYDDCDGTVTVPVTAATTQPPPPPPTTPSSTLTPAQRCARGEKLFAHGTQCQLYYNCSQVYEQIPRFFEQYMMECSYPNQFDQQRLACADFRTVNCGTRSATINACDYRSNWCPKAHCIPCTLNNPSCEGLPDGRASFPGREWTPRYMECLQERTIANGTCSQDYTFRVPQVFNPETKRCIHLFRVPREFGGLMPSCEGVADGAYPVEENIPGVSFICQGGDLLNIRYCPDGSSVRLEPRACVYT